jgi:hypothetical protein
LQLEPQSSPVPGLELHCQFTWISGFGTQTENFPLTFLVCKVCTQHILSFPNCGRQWDNFLWVHTHKHIYSHSLCNDSKHAVKCVIRWFCWCEYIVMHLHRLTQLCHH